MRTGGLILSTLLVLLVPYGCSPRAEPVEPEAPSATAAPEPEPPPGPAEPETVDTGHACASSKATCGGGACTLELKNDCETPLTCEAAILLRCRTPTELVEAHGRGRQTFPAKTPGELVITANCTMGDLVQTSFQSLACK
jgi:hypothetical protein